MALHLGRALGPLASWRVMQVLGELGAAAASERFGEGPAGSLARAVSRGQFLKGAGGALAGAAVLAGFGWVPLARKDGRSTAQAQEEEKPQEGCDFREPAYTYGELRGSDRDTVVINNYYYNPYFRVLYDTFYVAGFRPRPDAARVVSVSYTTSNGYAYYAYDLRLPFEGVGQQYPVLGVTSNQYGGDTSMAVFQRVSETDQASRVERLPGRPRTAQERAFLLEGGVHEELAGPVPARRCPGGGGGGGGGGWGG